MRIVHLQTTISSTFAVLDDEGNAVPQQPITAQVQKFSEKSFSEAFSAIVEARDKAATEIV